LLGTDLDLVTSPATAPSVRRALARAPTGRAGILERLKCLAILRQLGTSDNTAEADTVRAALSELQESPVGRSRVLRAHQLLQLLNGLHVDLSELTAEPFPVVTPEDRFAAIVLLGDLRHYRNAEAIRRYYTPLSASLIARVGTEERGCEFTARVWAIYATQGSVGDTTQDSLTRAARRFRRCPGFPDLFRPETSADRCTLVATADLFELGLAYP